MKLEEARIARQELITHMTEIEETRETINLWEDVISQIDKGVSEIDIEQIAALKVAENDLDIDLSEAVEEAIQITHNKEIDLKMELESQKQLLYDQTERLYQSERSIESLLYINQYNQLAKSNNVDNLIVKENDILLNKTLTLTATTLEDIVLEVEASQLAVASLADEGIDIQNYEVIDELLNKGYEYALQNNQLEEFVGHVSELKTEIGEYRNDIPELSTDNSQSLGIYEMKLEKLEEHSLAELSSEEYKKIALPEQVESIELEVELEDDSDLVI